MLRHQDRDDHEPHHQDRKPNTHAPRPAPSISGRPIEVAAITSDDRRHQDRDNPDGGPDEHAPDPTQPTAQHAGEGGSTAVEMMQGANGNGSR